MIKQNEIFFQILEDPAPGPSRAQQGGAPDWSPSRRQASRPEHDSQVIDGTAVAREVYAGDRAARAAPGRRAESSRALRLCGSATTPHPRSTCATRCAPARRRGCTRRCTSFAADCGEAARARDRREAERRVPRFTASWCSCRCRGISMRTVITQAIAAGKGRGRVQLAQPRRAHGGPRALRAVHAARRRGAARSGGSGDRGRHAVIVGRSNIVGKPLALMLLESRRDGDGMPHENARIWRITRGGGHPRRRSGTPAV